MAAPLRERHVNPGKRLHIPDFTMQVSEGISVIASFGLPYKLRPVRFRWNDRLMDIKEVTYQWQTREGNDRLYHFAVTDGSSTYELSFNSSSLVWNVEGVADPS